MLSKAKLRTRVVLLIPFSALLFSACGDISSRLPAGMADPKEYATPEAAEQLARNARYEFQLYLIDFMLDAGMISDEFYDPDSANKPLGYIDRRVLLDQRHLPDETLNLTALGDTLSAMPSYNGLQRVRSSTILARRALEEYAPEAPRELIGEMFAYEAYAEVMLADMYCSGIPLSTLDFNGDYTYKPGSRTAEVYQHAIHLFDTAISLSKGDLNIASMARVGKGRALLALGLYDAADTTVRSVPQGFLFDLPLLRTGNKSTANPTGYIWANPANVRGRGAIAEKKGHNGLPFRSADDPRIRLLDSSTAFAWRIPASQTRLLVANHIEARLIEAEARIQDGNLEFLDILNDLRTDGSYMVIDGDTIYYPGTGGVGGLAPLSDPALQMLPAGKSELDVRIDMLMSERAFWLFFTGRRQGDLRRLVRNYGRKIEETYPMGDYRGGVGFFDSYIDVPIPSGERFNPYYFGCLVRGE